MDNHKNVNGIKKEAILLWTAEVYLHISRESLRKIISFPFSTMYHDWTSGYKNLSFVLDRRINSFSTFSGSAALKIKILAAVGKSLFRSRCSTLMNPTKK